MNYAELELENQLLQLKRAQITGGRLVLCVGDSITYGYTVPRAACWCSLAGRLTGNRLINFGQCGDTTGGMRARYAALPESVQVDAVSLMGGGNDLMMGVGDERVCGNLIFAARLAEERGARPVLCLSPEATPPGVAPFFTYPPYFADSDEFDEARRRHNQRLREAALANGWEIADFSRTLCRGDGSGDPLCYNDNVHPNEEGHRRMAEVFAATLLRMFPKEGPHEL